MSQEELEKLSKQELIKLTLLKNQKNTVALMLDWQTSREITTRSMSMSTMSPIRDLRRSWRRELIYPTLFSASVTNIKGSSWGYAYTQYVITFVDRVKQGFACFYPAWCSNR